MEISRINSKIMIRSIKTITILIFLCLSNLIETTTEPSITDNNSAAGENKQSVISTCHGLRAVLGHDGRIGQWKVKCHVEVWNGKEQPVLTYLNPEERGNALSEINKSSTDPNIERTSSFLADQAKTRHEMCMLAKTTILDQLKQQLPAGYNSPEKIRQVIRDVKLTPELEYFINQISDPMKESLAKVKSVEDDKELNERERQDKLIEAKGELTALIDNACKDEHPSIKYHNIGYLPHPNLHKVKMTFVMPHPVTEKRVEVVHMPYEGYSPYYGQLDPLRQMAGVLAHHAKQTGKFGPFKVVMSANDKESGGGNVYTVINANENEIKNEQPPQPQSQSQSQQSGNNTNTDNTTVNTQVKPSNPCKEQQEQIVNTIPKVKKDCNSANNQSQKDQQTLSNTNTSANIENASNSSGQSVTDDTSSVQSSTSKDDVQPPVNPKQAIEQSIEPNLSAYFEALKAAQADFEKAGMFSTSRGKKYDEAAQAAAKDYLENADLNSVTPDDYDKTSTLNKWKKELKDLDPSVKDAEELYQKKKALLRRAQAFGEMLQIPRIKKAYQQGEKMIKVDRETVFQAYKAEKAKAEPESNSSFIGNLFPGSIKKESKVQENISGNGEDNNNTVVQSQNGKKAKKNYFLPSFLSRK